MMQAVSNAPIDPTVDEGPLKAGSVKTEEQRERLQEAVKNVFVFKNLDPEARSQVLDVMFERKVLAGKSYCGSTPGTVILGDAKLHDPLDRPSTSACFVS